MGCVCYRAAAPAPDAAEATTTTPALETSPTYWQEPRGFRNNDVELPLGTVQVMLASMTDSAATAVTAGTAPVPAPAPAPAPAPIPSAPPTESAVSTTTPTPTPTDAAAFMKVVITLPRPCNDGFELGRQLAQWFLARARPIQGGSPGTCSAVWHTLGTSQVFVIAVRFIQDGRKSEAYPQSLAAIAARLKYYPAWLPLPLHVNVCGVTEAQYTSVVAHAKTKVGRYVAELAAYGWVQRPIAKRGCRVRHYEWSGRYIMSASYVVRLATLDAATEDVAKAAERWVKDAFSAYTRSVRKHGEWHTAWLLAKPSVHFVSVLAYFVAETGMEDVASEPCLLRNENLVSSECLGDKLCEYQFPDKLAPVLCVGVSAVSEKFMDEHFALARHGGHKPRV